MLFNSLSLGNAYMHQRTESSLDVDNLQWANISSDDEWLGEEEVTSPYLNLLEQLECLHVLRIPPNDFSY